MFLATGFALLDPRR